MTRPSRGLRGTAALASLIALSWGADAHALDWSVGAIAAHEQWLSPELGGHGWVLVDARGRGITRRGGDLHLFLNTETLQAGVENLPLATPRLQFSAAVRAEGVYAGVLPDYRAQGRRAPGRGFWASYGYAFAAVKWLPGGPHSLELLVAGRRWHFARIADTTSPDLQLPPNTWVFEPRLRYTFWNVTSPGEEGQAQVAYPRVRGLAAGVELGADVRGDAQPWGALAGVDDGRNRPGRVIVTARQWLRAGWQPSPRVRVQLEQSASWGHGEDDLTRPRSGGMNPYVVPVPGLAWPSLWSERLIAAQASVHVRPSLRLPHEVGVALGAGAFSDVRRVGALDTYGGAGGVAAFADLRFGRWQAYLRAGYGFPVAWLPGTHVSVLAGLGVRMF
jgi:hypothetical protein